MPRKVIFDETAVIIARTHPDRLRAVLVLHRAGWTRWEIARGLKMSIRTVYRRVKEIDRVSLMR